MPSTQCWGSVRGRVLRATKLDSCGAPVVGACSTLVTKGFVSVQFSPEISEGEEIEVKRADGSLCISDQGCPVMKWLNIEAHFCQVDPDLFSMMTGYPTVLDYSGNAVGNRITGTIRCDGGIALELWSDIPGDACAAGGKQYGYWLAPWVVNGVIDAWTIENDAVDFQLNARTNPNSQWDVGPYDVDPTAVVNTPGPLITPIGPDDHMDMHLTTVAPPAAACGCVALAA
jgi:hypothetical protein